MSAYDDRKWDEAIRFAESELAAVEKRRRQLMRAIVIMRRCKKDRVAWPVAQQDSGEKVPA